MTAGSLVASGLAAAAAAVLVLPRGAAVTRRLTGLPAPAPSAAPSPRGARPRGSAPGGPGRTAGHRRTTAARDGPDHAVVAPGLRLAAGLAAATVGVVLLGGAAGALVGALAATAAAVGTGHLPRVGADDADRRARADLPLALDLLAACSASGVPLPDAIDAVARAVGGPLGASWSRSCAALRLGGDAATLWGHEPLLPLRRPGRVLAAALDGGSASAGDLERLAAEEREAARRRGETAARSAGVAAVLPLGLCFLPAFVLVGIVPVVVGLAGGVLQ